MAELEVFGEGVVVGDVFDVLRAGPARGLGREVTTGFDPAARLIRGRDLTIAGELLPESDGGEDRFPKGWAPVDLRTGDLVMREIETPGRVGIPVEIQGSDLPAAAATSVQVLRLREPIDREEFDFYKLYLVSWSFNSFQ